jgi:hypothetical protein
MTLRRQVERLAAALLPVVRDLAIRWSVARDVRHLPDHKRRQH